MTRPRLPCLFAAMLSVIDDWMVSTPPPAASTIVTPALPIT